MENRADWSYIGGVGNYHRQCDEIAAQGYPGFEMA
jgi:acetone monooxygenase